MNEKRILQRALGNKQTLQKGERLLSKKLAGKILDEAMRRTGSSASPAVVLQTAGKVILEASERTTPRLYNLEVSLDDIALERYNSLDEALADAEKRVICAALETVKDGRDAAKMLGITGRSLKYRIVKHGIPTQDLRWRKDKTFSQDAVFEPFCLDAVLGDLEIKLIKPALVKSENNLAKAAELLGVTMRSLRYRVCKYGLDAGIDLSRALEES